MRILSCLCCNCFKSEERPPSLELSQRQTTPRKVDAQRQSIQEGLRMNESDSHQPSLLSRALTPIPNPQINFTDLYIRSDNSSEFGNRCGIRLQDHCSHHNTSTESSLSSSHHLAIPHHSSYDGGSSHPHTSTNTTYDSSLNSESHL
jgi:hypothetical protein